MRQAQSKEEQIVDTLNTMIKACEPIRYSTFNKFIRAKDNAVLLQEEKLNDKIGLSTAKIKQPDGTYLSDDRVYGISTISIIATITDILMDKRLAVTIDYADDIITGFTFNYK